MTVQLPEGADDVGRIEGDQNSSAYTKKGKLKTAAYEEEMERLQEQLVLLQYWIQSQGLKVLVIFEGRGSAGKGGVIKRITERTSPRTVKVVALPKPTERQRTQWYFQRYVEHLPAAGEMVMFDRSWYNRSNVEWVMGYCTEEEYQEFLRSCPEFERMLVRSGIQVIKYWFSVSYEEQRKRFEARNAEPLKRWKLSDMDLAEHELYVKYSMAKDTTFQYTDIKQAPWYVVPSDDKKAARLNCINHLLSQFQYVDVAPDVVELPGDEADPLRAAADARADVRAQTVLAMRRRWVVVLLLTPVAGCGDDPSSSPADGGAPMTIEVTSTAFAEGEPIPERSTRATVTRSLPHWRGPVFPPTLPAWRSWSTTLTRLRARSRTGWSWTSRWRPHPRRKAVCPRAASRQRRRRAAQPTPARARPAAPTTTGSRSSRSTRRRAWPRALASTRRSPPWTSTPSPRGL